MHNLWRKIVRTFQSFYKRKDNRNISFVRNLSIGTKYLLIFSVSVLLFTIATVVIYFQLTTANDNVNNVIHKSELSDRMSQLALLVERQDSVVANYSIIGGAPYIKEFDEINEQLEEVFQQLEKEFVGQKDNEFILNIIIERQAELVRLFHNQMTNESLSESDLTDAHISYGSAKSSNVDLINRLIDHINEERNFSTEQVRGSMTNSLTFLITVNVLSILIGFIILLLISRIISNHLNNVVTTATYIADGNLTVEQIDYIGNDEIGKINAAMNALSANIRNIIKNVTEASQATANNSESLAKSSHEVKKASDQMVSTMQELASGAESQADSASDLSEKMHQFVEDIQTSQQEGQAVANSSEDVLLLTSDGANLMKQSVTQMDKIDTIVSDAVHKVRGLDEQSAEISQLVDVVKDIAEQTNLLALNASIEAARAGEHGRGFAVVADEVGKLAEEVTSSVTEITSIVGNIQHETNEVVTSLNTGYGEVKEGINQIEKTGDSFNLIDESVSGMVKNIVQIANRLKEIAENSTEMNELIENIAAVSEEAAAGVEQSSALTQETSSAMDEISRNADELSALAEQLNKEIDAFKVS